jgi:hypothetical protein
VSGPGPAAPGDARVRAALLGIFLFGALGTLAELLLLDHTGEPPQWVPLVLLGTSVLVLAWYGLARSAASVRIFRGLMVLFAAAGMLGVVLHFRGNLEFERELHPEATSVELLVGALKGATPALAPGTMTMLGLIGLLYAYGHPSLRPSHAAPAPLPRRE